MSGQELKLVFDKVDFVRTLHGYGFFPDVVFHAEDNAAKKYLIDFWVKPEADKLVVFDTRIYKAPRQEGTSWTLMARQPIPWWWIPASEHPGKTEQARGWEVMSAVEEDIVKERAKDNGTFKLKDAKTGEEVKLEFVGTHQPVRRLQQDSRFLRAPVAGRHLVRANIALAHRQEQNFYGRRPNPLLGIPSVPRDPAPKSDLTKPRKSGPVF